MTPHTTGRIPALDGLRGIAVVLVIIAHYIHWIALGSLGVGIFYVLSGFLITGLLLAEHRRNGTITLSRFYIRRALRIMPAFYVFLLLAWLVLRNTPDNPPLDSWLASLFYYADYYAAVHVQRASQISHTWSLAVEEQFYLVWPALLVILMRRGTSIRFLALLIGAVWLWRLTLTYLLGVHPHYLQFAFDTRADYLAVGCLLAMSRDGVPVRAVTESARQYPVLAVLTALLLAVVTVTLSDTRAYALSYPIEVVLIAVLMIQLIGASRSPLWRWLDHPVSRWLGALSYSLYLYHMLARYLVEHPVLAVGVGITMAALSYYLVELPVLRWRDHQYRAAAARHDLAAPGVNQVSATQPPM